MVATEDFAQYRLLNARQVELAVFPPGSPVVLLHRLWQSIAPAGGGLPGRQHLDPLDIAPQILPWVFLMDVVRDGDAALDYRYRLVGTGNVTLVGRDATGELASTVFGRVEAPFVLDTFDLTVHTRKPTFWIATVPQDRFGAVTIHRGLCPMARDGRTINMLLCVAAPWPAD